MNEKLNRILIVLTVSLAVFALASVAAVLIVESKIKQIPRFESGYQEKSAESAQNGGGEETLQSAGEQDERGQAADEAASTYELELEGGARVEKADGSAQTDKKKPTPSEVVESIPFSEKLTIIKKYMPKLSADDIKLFMSLLSAEKPDYKAAEKRLCEIYSAEEIKALYNIYKNYEGKLYDSESQ